MVANDDRPRVSQPRGFDLETHDPLDMVDRVLFEVQYERYRLDRAVRLQDAGATMMFAAAATGLVLGALCAALNRVALSDVAPRAHVHARMQLEGARRSRVALIEELDRALPKITEPASLEVLTKVRFALALADDGQSVSPPPPLKAEPL